MEQIQRRSFLKASAAVAVATAAAPAVAAEEPLATVYVVHGKDIPKMMEAGIAKLGGWGAFIKKGSKVAIKPNVAWASTPEQGGNTQPEMVRQCVLAAEKLGASKISVPENTCQPEHETFAKSGVEAALKGTKAHLYRPKKDDFKEVELPKGRTCKKAEVTKDLLEADCLVDMPVAKHHGGATLTLSIKNWMGAVSNNTRRGWHRDGLHQCLADFSTFIKPKIIIIDATRIMLDHGPQGPGKLAHPDEIIFSTDTVAADAYAATLFGKKPEDIPHIRIAGEMGVGCADLKRIKIERIEA